MWAVLHTKFPGESPQEALAHVLDHPNNLNIMGMTNERAYQMQDLAHKNWSTQRVQEPIHMIPVTPTLRSSALTRGFPLFQHVAGAGLGAGGALLLQKYLAQQRDSKSPQN